jgi:hypothetical protein
MLLCNLGITKEIQCLEWYIVLQLPCDSNENVFLHILPDTWQVYSNWYIQLLQYLWSANAWELEDLWWFECPMNRKSVKEYVLLLANNRPSTKNNLFLCLDDMLLVLSGEFDPSGYQLAIRTLLADNTLYKSRAQDMEVGTTGVGTIKGLIWIKWELNKI